MRIGELAQASGFTRDTIRFYEERGLLTSRREANGYRDYTASTVQLLHIISIAQEIGFTLAEIEAHLPVLKAPDITAPVVREELQRKLESIESRIAELSAMRDKLAAFIAMGRRAALPGQPPG